MGWIFTISDYSITKWLCSHERIFGFLTPHSSRVSCVETTIAVSWKKGVFCNLAIRLLITFCHHIRRESFILQIRTYQNSFASALCYVVRNNGLIKWLQKGLLEVYRDTLAWLHYFRPHGSNLKLDRHVWQYKYPGSHRHSGSVYNELVTALCEEKDPADWILIQPTLSFEKLMDASTVDSPKSYGWFDSCFWGFC